MAKEVKSLGVGVAGTRREPRGKVGLEAVAGFLEEPGDRPAGTLGPGGQEWVQGAW